MPKIMGSVKPSRFGINAFVRGNSGPDSFTQSGITSRATGAQARICLPIFAALLAVFFAACERKTETAAPPLPNPSASPPLATATRPPLQGTPPEVTPPQEEPPEATPPPEESAIPEPPPPPPLAYGEGELPPFPWPPPKASAFQVLPRNLLVAENKPARLEDVNATLLDAFQHCGYSDTSYYSVPDGFAIASRIEQINADGTPSSNRWSLDVWYIEKVSIKTYLRALFKAPRGHYRVIVFIVTPHPFSEGNTELSASEAEKLVTKGADTLSGPIGDREYSSNYKCTALIYEFKVTGQKATFVQPSEITSQMHLENAGLLAALSQPK